MKKRFIAMILAASMVMGSQVTVFAEPQEDPDDYIEHDVDGDEHGTTEGALIGDEGDFADDGDNVTGSTQFYLNIDKDANHTDDTIIIKDADTTEGYINVCHYDIEYSTQLESHIRATVPLYVCMYAYGGTGEVITPDEDAYAIENESTYTDKKWVSRITPYYVVMPISSYDEFIGEEYEQWRTDIARWIFYYDGTDENLLKFADCFYDEYDSAVNGLVEEVSENCDNTANENMYNILIYLVGCADDNTGENIKNMNNTKFTEAVNSGRYGIYALENWYDGYVTDNKCVVVKMSECGRHSDDDDSDDNAGCYYIKGDDVTCAETASCYVFTPEDENFSEEYSNNSYGYGWDVGYAANSKALALNVPTVRTEASWTLEPMSAGTLRARQLSMSVNGLDLSSVDNASSFGESHTLDITGLGWVVPAFEAEEKSYDGLRSYEKEYADKFLPDVLKTPGRLNLPIQAAIAGGNLNEEGCAPVVKVTYMLSPAYNLIDRDYSPVGHYYSDES